MDKCFALPDLGEGLAEAELVSWHVSPGDHVVTGQPLASVETDKAVVEVPSPHSGHIEKLHGEPGDRIAVGDTLVEFAEGEMPDTGAIVGDARDQPSRAAAPTRPPGHKNDENAARIRAAPAVRARAHEFGVDLSGVHGTGKDGTITMSDLEAHAPSTGVAGEPILGVRRAMLVNMTRAGAGVVPATITAEADIDEWPEHTDITMRLVRAISVACRASPALNAWLDAESETRVLHEHIDIGIAMETGDGLFTPVLRAVNDADTAALRGRLEELKAKVRERRVDRTELGGQTITLSNFGMFRGRFAALVVVPPQVAILGAGRAEPRVVTRAGEISVRRILPLSLTFDHRAVTGVEAARFLDAAINSLESAAGP